MSENKIEYKVYVPVEEAANHFDFIAKGLRDGEVNLALGLLSMSMPAQNTKEVKVDLKAKSEDGKSKLLLELSWANKPEVEEPPVVEKKE